jgi:dTDP-4-dehydrorhamnose reductase
MNTKPFPHKKALVDMTKSLIFDDEAAKITLKLLHESGVINVGGKSRSVYDFVKETNPDIEPMTLSEVSDVSMPKSSTLNIDKLKRIIDDSTV